MTCRYSRLSRSDEEYHMRDYAEKLLSRSVSIREAALEGLVDGFRKKTHHEFLKNKTITFLHQILKSMKWGSTKERQLASSVIGLLSISVGLGDGVAHDILQESICHIRFTLRYAKNPLGISSVLDLLAFITVVGGQDTKETERSMQMIWEVINPVSRTSCNAVATQPDPDVLSTAIYAWSFLLTTVKGSQADCKIWKQSLLYFSNLLEHDKEMVCLTAAVAIAHIFETGFIEKFYSQANVSNDGSVEENKQQGSYAQIKEFKGEVLNKVRDLSVILGYAEQDHLRKQHITCQKVSKFLQAGTFCKYSTKIGKHVMEITSWSKYIQITFLREYLGVGFAKYLEDNEVLRDIIDFTLKRQIQDPTLECEHEERFRLPNSIVKAKTKEMNKKRTISRDRHFAFGYED